MESRLTYSQLEVDEIVKLIKLKLKADSNSQKSIRAKIRKLGFKASEFGFRGGYTPQDFLSVIKIGENLEQKPSLEISKKFNQPQNSKRANSDEAYVLELCDEILKQISIRQHRFDFLRGDTGTKLPVDAYYPALNLVVEYHEKQHTEEVKFFDKRLTKSGVSRGEQRKIYDERRRELIPKHGLKLIEIGYQDFAHTSTKKLIRNRESDLKIIRNIFKKTTNAL